MVDAAYTKNQAWKSDKVQLVHKVLSSNKEIEVTQLMYEDWVAFPASSFKLLTI